MHDLIQTIKAYFKQFKNVSAQGVIFLLVGLGLVFIPVIYFNHLHRQVTTYQTQTKNNQNEIKNLNAKAKHKVKMAKIQAKNLPQTQNLLNKQIDQLLKAQLYLLQYSTNGQTDTTKMQEANKITINMLSNPDLVDKTNGCYLLAPLSYGNAANIHLKAGYTPSFSVTQAHIDIVIETLYKSYPDPINIIYAQYDLKSHKIDSFSVAQTAFSDKFVAISEKGTGAELAKKDDSKKKPKATKKKQNSHKSKNANKSQKAGKK